MSFKLKDHQFLLFFNIFHNILVYWFVVKHLQEYCYLCTFCLIPSITKTLSFPLSISRFVGLSVFPMIFASLSVVKHTFTKTIYITRVMFIFIYRVACDPILRSGYKSNKKDTRKKWEKDTNENKYKIYMRTSTSKGLFLCFYHFIFKYISRYFLNVFSVVVFYILTDFFISFCTPNQ